jgi:RNA polymerase sigma-70 factor (ECF subfamily)
MPLDEHLFRREYGRLVSSLTRIFGVHNLGLAEDAAQEAFCRAVEVWSLRGAPENPQAWLMATARNRALDVIRRQRTAAGRASDVEWSLRNEQTLQPALDDVLLAGALNDDLLRMMFACCDPRLPERTQVALMLQILCGFSVGETAAAFMSGHAAMEKRLGRAKSVLATSRRLFDITSSPQVVRRLPAVQRALYLLFNEGYHGASPETSIRADLCQEAMRLTALLLNDSRCATPATHALGAVMCLHAARLPARVDAAGDLVALSQQDRARWDQGLVVDGLALLELAATGPRLSGYHLEAAIAAIHADAPHLQATDWGAIVSLYDTLMRLEPSPIVALNRAVAVALHRGPARGLAEVRAIRSPERLSGYPFYFAALGELEWGSGDAEAASVHFREAIRLARNPMERRFLARRLAACEAGATPLQDLEGLWDHAFESYRAVLESDPASN